MFSLFIFLNRKSRTEEDKFYEGTSSREGTRAVRQTDTNRPGMATGDVHVDRMVPGDVTIGKMSFAKPEAVGEREGRGWRSDLVE